ncbi:MAG: acyl carrier protein [Bacteroidota bacterium]|nr:acyl carrier protein [Bacteroidota bacterium]
MDRSEILHQLHGIFVDALDSDGIKLTNETTADEVEGWDSLTHIQLVVGIEKHFKIRFTSQEIQRWKNVGELVESIHNKLV